ncbi:hypothetical protein [Microbispora sp. KK1-11]|uniref:hypothetical protein n=1 Tax=Microbispora sp. KK1-11 TaxID=2053005 RepID=UPI0011574168|nr:hypothetical protein [Microbispora sp. KK1-11]TQS22792.1 hypothetical protein FLW16_37675 [Microbispora sp. KK1-11]
MPRSPLVAAVLGALLAICVAGAAALTLALTSSAPAAAPAVVPRPTPPSSSDDPEEEAEEDPGQRHSAGTSWPLRIDREIREELAGAVRRAGAPTDAADVAGGGTVYYGIIYGESEATDEFYVVAMLDRLHYWTKQGPGEWRYQGAYDARVCVPPVPAKMYASWGLSFSTSGPQQVCAG